MMMQFQVCARACVRVHACTLVIQQFEWGFQREPALVVHVPFILPCVIAGL